MTNAQQVAADLNTVAAFLAAPHLDALSPAAVEAQTGHRSADLLILLGNSVLQTIPAVAEGMNSGAADRLLVVGGVGHSTRFLRHQVRRSERYEGIAVDGRAEAAILRDLLVQGHGLDEDEIWTECESTNCGANAENASKLLQSRERSPERIILVQDPTMQRRTWASFRRVWGEESSVRFLNGPPFVPRVQPEHDALAFKESSRIGRWSMDRFVSLVMGEIPRLRNDENGYGPRGAGYIVAVDIPSAVEAAYRRLLDPFGEAVRPPR